MAKSLRSNNKKALRTVRRKTLAEDPKWQAAAEQQRLNVMAAVLAAPRPPQGGEGRAKMDTETSGPAVPVAAAGARAAADAAGAMEIEPTGSAPQQQGSGVHLTKKKMMKAKLQKRLKAEASWKSGTISAFHVKTRKLKRRRY